MNFTGFDQTFYYKQKPFVARIFEGEGEPPQGFNCAQVFLDASEKSLLKWDQAIACAERHIEKGLLILWNLHFDLSQGSLEESSRFLTLQLSVRHFNETIWPLFREKTFGVSLFKGALTLQTREVVVDYVKLLAATLPDELPCFFFLDASAITDRLTYFQLINPEAFGHLHLVLKSPYAQLYPYASPVWGWGQIASPLGYCAHVAHTSPNPMRISQAICLSEHVESSLFERAIEALHPRPFRVIAENLLTQEWEGIDQLIVFPHALSERGWRKVKGFVAAGGEILKFPDDVI